MKKIVLPDIADPADPSRWLAACPIHSTTTLRPLDALAASLGWSLVYAKDETDRMGLGSFKALGGAYAVLCLVRDRLREVLKQEPSINDIKAAKGGDALCDLTVCCASAGNHGLSVAAGAMVFGVPCEVFLAKSVPESFADRLRGKGATVVRVGAVYEDAMAAAVAHSHDDGVTLVSDASWEGEMHVPSLVMQGYAVIADDIYREFSHTNDWPTHVALQAGVGGIAASVTAHIRRHWPIQPKIIVVEPDRAACLKNSVAAGHSVRADGLVSNMGRLDCKEPSLRAFEVLREMADCFVLISDEQALTAESLLRDHGLLTTPSGAAGLAGMIQYMPDPDARVLILVTEGEVA
ncbi:MAG: diaminopropionate ammonia-lyase [Litoreibacter sp.]